MADKYAVRNLSFSQKTVCAFMFALPVLLIQKTALLIQISVSAAVYVPRHALQALSL